MHTATHQTALPVLPPSHSELTDTPSSSCALTRKKTPVTASLQTTATPAHSLTVTVSYRIHVHGHIVETGSCPSCLTVLVLVVTLSESKPVPRHSSVQLACVSHWDRHCREIEFDPHPRTGLPHDEITAPVCQLSSLHPHDDCAELNADASIHSRRFVFPPIWTTQSRRSPCPLRYHRRVSRRAADPCRRHR